MWRRQGRDCFRGVRCDSPVPLKLCGAREHRRALAMLNFSGNANKNLAWQTVRAWGDNLKVSAPPWPTPYIISQGSILPINVCRAVSPWLGSQPTVALTSKSKAAPYKLCRHPCLHVCTLPLLHTGILNSLGWKLGVTKALSAGRLCKLCFLQSDLGCWHLNTGIKFIWPQVFGFHNCIHLHPQN